MSKLLIVIRNLFHYIGLSPEEYQLVREDIHKSNRTNVAVFSGIGAGAFMAMVILSIARGGIFTDYLGIYLGAVGFFLLLLVVNLTIAKKYSVLSNVSVCLFMSGVLAIGMYMAAVVTPTERTTSYLVFLMTISALFCVKPIALCLIIVACECVFIFIINQVQTDALLMANMTNSIVYSMVSMIVGCYIMSIKAAKLNSDRINCYLSETDRLTNMPNRRSYEFALEKLRKEKRDVIIVAYDVNGLKKTNDTLGHDAGDELICAAAQCIQMCFGAWGTCYRTGGDEFIAILETPFPNMEELNRQFREMM